jgi:hypothetical protein
MMEEERIILLIAVETNIQLMRNISCAVSGRLKENPALVPCRRRHRFAQPNPSGSP